jgi:virginiamycin B lyase
MSSFAIPTAASTPQYITAGPDGALWFTEYSGNKLGRVATSGTFTEFPMSIRAGKSKR